MSRLTDLRNRFRRRHVDRTSLPVMHAALIVCRSDEDTVIVGRTGGPNRRITGDEAAGWLAAAEYVFGGEHGLRLLVPAEAFDAYPGAVSAVVPARNPRNHSRQDRDRGKR